MMQVTSRSIVRRGIVGVCVAAASAIGFVTAGRAETMPSHPNIITLSQPAALPGRVLPPGVYVFEVANPETASDVIRVRKRKTGQSLDTSHFSAMCRSRTGSMVSNA